MKNFAALIFFILICSPLWPQSGIHTIPKNIYVGDKAVLILPLPGTAQNSGDIVLSPSSADFPLHENIDFHKITLERRTGTSRLMVEFTAFAVGLLELPPIEIGVDRFSGLSFTVNSITEDAALNEKRSSLTLSGPASSLAMPGTALMFYGTIAAIIFFILLTIWFFLKGRVFLKKWKEKYKYWKLFNSMKLIEKRLYKNVFKGADKRIILDKLSGQFRVFLSIMTGINCRSMTAGNFETREFEMALNNQRIMNRFNLSLLGKFFNKCDELRFSGDNIDSQEIINLLDSLRNFIVTMEDNKRLTA
jgi:hypothetical protein